MADRVARHDLRAGRPHPDADRLETDPGAGGALYLRGAAARFQCTVHHEVRAGDHVIVALRVAAHAADPATPPLVFHGSRFHLLAERPAG